MPAACSALAIARLVRKKMRILAEALSSELRGLLPLHCRPGLACVWDNRRFLHSTVPIQIYSEGSRVMWQIIHRVGDLDDEEEQYLAAYYNKRSKAEETPKL